MDDKYNGLKVGDIVEAIDGGYQFEVLRLGDIPDGRPWTLIPSTQPRVFLRALQTYGDVIEKDSEHSAHPSSLRLVSPTKS